jgi:hypothetical protein
MIMADVLKIFLLVVGALIVFNSYWLAGQALFPRMVERSSRQYVNRPIKTLLLGLIVAGPLVLIGLAILENLAGNPLMNIFGWSFILIPALLGVLGSTGWPGRWDVDSLPEDEGQPWLRVLRGGTVLSFTLLPPSWVGCGIAWTVVSGWGGDSRHP